MKRPGLSSLIVCVVLGLWAQAAIASDTQPVHTYALVVGADAYEHLPHLRGGLNDAEMLAALLRDRGAEVHTLLDKEVTRDAILSELRQLIGRARAGDWVIFTYSGHGGQEPVNASPGDIVDTFLLPHFDNPNPLNAERIRNHEFHALLQTVPKDVNVLFVADSCHSGSMVRSWDPRAATATYRAANYGPIVDDAAPPIPKSADTSSEFNLSNVVFIGAAADDQNAPEISFDGQFHGAVSWYFAKALRGEAAASPDGTTNLNALRKFVVIGAGEAAESRQTPRVEFLAGRENEPLPFVARATEAIAGPSLGQPVSVAVIGGDKSLLSTIAGVTASAGSASADFAWDVRAGTVISNRLGDLVAEHVSTSRALAGVIDKWRALPAIRAMMIKHPLSELQISPGPRGARYSEGTEVTVSIPASGNPALHYLTAFDLTSTGVIQLLVPAREQEGGMLEGQAVLPERNRVVAPFGADHVVAIWTATRPDRLRAGLAAAACTLSPLDLVQLLAEVTRGDDYALAIAPLYTAPAQASADSGASSACG